MTGRGIFAVIILLLVLANFFVWREVFDISKRALKVVFFDVGQGDSIFIETPQNHQILIDGGPSGKKVLEKLAGQIPFWDRSLDLVVLTHPDYDHLAGLNWVLQRYKVENILWTGVEKDTKTFQRWRENLKLEKEKEGARIFIAQKGQKIKAGEVKFYILYPLESLTGELFERASNDTSIVSQLVFGRNKFLFTGDITEKTERKILEETINLESGVLKIAHHGSKTSSSEEFLEKVRPQIAVISVGGNNPYGHPYPEVLRALENFGIKILRTDEMGDIKIMSDGFSNF